mgnify:CR=1 FL=1
MTSRKSSRPSPDRHLFLCAGFILISVALVLTPLAATNFCWKRMKWIEDSEYAAAAMEVSLASWKIADPNFHQKLLKVYSAEDCCTVHRLMFGPVFVSVMTSEYGRRLDDSPPIDNPTYVLDACGCVREEVGSPGERINSSSEQCLG